MTQAPLPIGLMCPTSIWICQVEFKSPSLSFIRLWAVGTSFFSVFFRLKTSFKRDSFNTTSIFYFCFYLSQSKNLWHEWGGSKCKYFFFYKQSKWWLWINHQKKSCIHDYFAIAEKENAAKKLVFWHFLLRLECAKIKGRHKNIFFFLFHVDHCSQFLFAGVAAKMTFLFLLRFLFVLFALCWPGGGSEGKRRQKYLICIFYDQLMLQRKHRYNISVARGLQKR